MMTSFKRNIRTFGILLFFFNYVYYYYYAKIVITTVHSLTKRSSLMLDFSNRDPLFLFSSKSSDIQKMSSYLVGEIMQNSRSGKFRISATKK
jgi:hypothetical protein